MESIEPPFALLPAIATGNLQELLTSIQSHGVLDENARPTSVSAQLKDVERGYEAAFERLLSLSIPVTFLNRLLTDRSELGGVLAMLRANLHLLPSVGASICPIDHMLAVSCDSEELNTASTTLVQRVTHANDELVEAWNALAPAEHTASDITMLPVVIQTLRTRTAQRRQETRLIDIAIAKSYHTSLWLLQEATRDAIRAVDTDTAERARSNAADISRVEMLSSRGCATAAKMRLVRMEVAAMTYTEESVTALNAISEAVRRRTHHIQEELEEKSARLANYRALGSEFERVVNDYVRIKSKLEQLLWSKRELGLTT